MSDLWIRTSPKNDATTPKGASRVPVGCNSTFLSGLATYVTIVRLLESEKWVVHTYEVQAALGNIDSATLQAGRSRSGYVITGSPTS
jgi:CHASE3 domain sensor protein